MSGEQITKLEELWKTEPDARFADLDRPDAIDETELQPTLLHYEDGYHYQNVLAPLVKMEADYDREWKEQMREDNVSLQWVRSAVSGVVVAELSFSLATSESLRLTVGDALEISVSKGLLYNQRGIDTAEDWRGTGTVKALTYRVGIWVVLFILIVVGLYTGTIKPGGSLEKAAFQTQSQ